MILEYSIANTLSIKDKQTISFEAVKTVDNKSSSSHIIQTFDKKKILKMACIYGANASGKTNILTAFYFYINFILDSFTELKPNEDTHFVPFMFTKESDKLAGEFEIIFYVPDSNNNFIKYEYFIKLNQQQVLEEVLYYSPKRQKKLLYERKEQKIKWGTDFTATSSNVIEQIVRPNCSIISTGAQVNQPIISYLYKYIKNRFRGIIFPTSILSNYVLRNIEDELGFKEKALGVLNASDISPVTDIKIEEQECPDEVLNLLPQEIRQKILATGQKPKQIINAKLSHKIGDEDYDLPLELESNGTKRMMELTKPLLDLANSSVILIDELEVSLHQDLLETFILLFLEISKDSQIIFTTHNQDLLDSELLRDDEVWFCYKDIWGKSEYNSITDYIGIRKEASRKKLYKAGKFGCLPNISLTELKELFCAEENQ